MIATLARRDIALRGTFYTWLPLSIFVGIILAGAGRITRLDPGAASMAYPQIGSVLFYALIIAWLLLSLYLGPAEVADHCSRMTITLPLSAKTLWLSRVLALVIAESVLFSITGLTIVLVNLITGSSTLLPTYLAKYLILMFSCVLLLIPAIQSLYIKRMAMPSIFSSYAILLLVWLAAGALLYALLQVPTYYALFPLAGAAIITLIALPRLPASFTTELQTYQQVRPGGNRLALQSPGFISRLKIRWIVQITLFRTLYNPWLSPLFLFVTGILAMANMDYGLRGKGHITMVVGMWMFLLLLQFVSIQQLYKLNHLPISRSIIFACQVLPIIGVILVMSIVGIAAANTTANLNPTLVPWTRILPLNLVLILVPWFIILTFIFAAPKASGLVTRLSILTAVCSLGYIGTLLTRFSGELYSETSGLLTLSLRDLSLKIPIETPILWILAVIILTAGYYITERVFNTAQLAPLKQNK
jgi:hypothetical protein